MGNDSDVQKIRCALDNARREINRGRSSLAIRILQGIKNEILSHEGTLEWVEFSLVTGEAFSAMEDAMAETFFKEAEEKAAKVPNLPAVMLIRLYEHFGLFRALVSRKLSLARPLFERAKKFAVGQHLEEEAARIELYIIRVDLQTDGDPEKENFITLKRVANDRSFTCAEQLMAWCLHLGKVAELERQARFARGLKKMSDDYFIGLLSSTRDQQP